jgi:LPS export ABC transporter protein LptC
MRRSTAGLVCLALIACGGPPSGTATPAPSALPAATAVPTPEPVHIETNGNGDKYITVVQRVAVAGSSKRTRIAYQLRAVSSQADIVGEQSVVTFEEPHITFVDGRGKKLVARSPQAKITQRDKSVLMSGGVRARAEDGSVLTCDTLRYDGRTEKLHGEGNVTLTGPSELTLTGRYLEGDVRLDDVRIAQHPL